MFPTQFDHKVVDECRQRLNNPTQLGRTDERRPKRTIDVNTRYRRARETRNS